MIERHTRILSIRCSQDEDWKLWGFNNVQFGYRQAAILLSVAVEKAA